ncbi:MAG: FAD-dependent oxidoreductase [Mobilicoccus sp.]|nr:FAD-dependent oxidoreductase [Mobilicoccus sp.]
MSTDVLVVGSGLAGLATALRLAEQGADVTVCTPEPDPAAGTSSALAQGGLAAAVGPHDSPARHAADTIAAGAGLTHPDVATRITAAGPDVVAALLALGARLDTDSDGALRLGLEGAHGRHRIVHADGDGSGAEILRAVADAALAHPRVTLRRARVTTLLGAGTIRGARVVAQHGPGTGTPESLGADAVVLATGGIGGLFAHTTNPLSSWGSGLALGLRAGARVRDLELVQFHPTALAVGLDPMPLVSEAVRGEGVVLVRGDGTPLGDPLAGRDVVARAVWDALADGDEVFLDVPGGPEELRAHFAARFPRVHAAAVAAGLDPARDRLPVRPAAHYHMGGLLVDEQGRTDVRGLWAVGEVASTGLHGANRLASNSLLEALVCAREVASSVVARLAGRSGWSVSASPVAPVTSEEVEPAAPTWADRRLLEDAAGLYRHGDALRRAADEFARPHVPGSADARLVASLLVQAALDRSESRGAHRRLDHPDAARPRHTTVSLAHAGVHLERSA